MAQPLRGSSGKMTRVHMKLELKELSKLETSRAMVVVRYSADRLRGIDPMARKSGSRPQGGVSLRVWNRVWDLADGHGLDLQGKWNNRSCSTHPLFDHDFLFFHHAPLFLPWYQWAVGEPENCGLHRCQSPWLDSDVTWVAIDVWWLQMKKDCHRMMSLEHQAR